MTHRSWVFTLNNPQDIGLTFSDDVKYAIYQRERGESGTEHLQGYVELTKPMRLSGVRRVFNGGDNAHWEPRRGSRDQARDYCRKEDSRMEGPWEHGTWTAAAQGRRSDLETLEELLKAGKTAKEISDTHTGLFLKHYRGIYQWRVLHSTDRDYKTAVTLLIGPPGCGKSREARDIVPNAYWKSNGEWWDGYDAHDDVVLDDFFGWIPYTSFLHMADRFPHRVPFKGGFHNFAAKRVIITTNTLPEHWYDTSKRHIHLDAILRRIDKVIYWTRDYERRELVGPLGGPDAPDGVYETLKRAITPFYDAINIE